jgi:DNA-binding response OmpR family regulator
VEAGKVFCGEKEVSLTKLEYRILYILFSNPTRLFTREELLDAVWDSAGNFVNDNTLTVTIKRLREKIGDKEGKMIQTVRGMGYRLG